MSRPGAAPAHYADSWLLGFYYNEVSPRLDRRAVWPDLVERGDRLEDAKCAGCGRADTYTYPDSQTLFCSHLNSCGRKEAILDKISGTTRPSGTRLLEAVQEAARLASALFPNREITPEEKEQAKRWGQRRDCIDASIEWAKGRLHADTPEAAAARAYLEARGFTPEAVADLDLGLFGAARDLERHLDGLKLSMSVAKDAALLLGNFQGYITFPWRDEHGSALTIYGRWPGKETPLKAEHPGRWKDAEKEPHIPKTYALPGENTKADPLYLDRARKARVKELVLVEGVIDAAIAQTHGDPRVVAYVAGTLAGRQVDAIAKLQPRSVTLCPDPDAGGDAGVLSAIKRLGEVGVRCYVAPRLPDGQDPDEFILAQGIEEWKRFLDRGEAAPVHLARLAVADIDSTTPAKRREEALKAVADLVAGLDGDGSSLDKTAIVKLACERLGYAKAEIHAEIGKRKKAQREKPDRSKLREVPKTPGHADSDWRKKLMWTESQNGNATLNKNLANAATILAHHPAWRDVLAFDDFAQKAVALKCPPSHGRHYDPENYPHRWGDHDDSLAAVWLQRGDPPLDVDVRVARSAVDVVSRLRRIHPVREYLDALAWDGVGRLDGWLVRYLGAGSGLGAQATDEATSKYLAAVGAKWMIAAVARIYSPGCKADTVLVLEGEQGLRKSTALKVLGGAWFTDELADVGSKDASVQLQGAWIIELAELDALSKAESAKIKSFFTRTVERYVPKYAKHPLEVPRQCVFAGTVNHGTYLRDETGNRRFWPVRCTKIDIDALKADRDQLWAEAVVRFRKGEPWFLDREMEPHAQAEQDARYQRDAWEPVIHGYVETLARTSLVQVLECALRLERGKWGQSEQNRAARCLQALGWVRKRARLRADELSALGLSGSSSGLAWIYERKDREPGEETP